MKKKADQGFYLQIITPERLLYEGPASSVISDTTDGQMGILKGRAPACVLLKKDGRIRFRPAADAPTTREAGALAVDAPPMRETGTLAVDAPPMRETGTLASGRVSEADRAAGVAGPDRPHPTPAACPQVDEDGFVNAGLSGGFAYINKECIIYADDAWWSETDETDETDEMSGAGHRPADREAAPVPLQKLTPNTPPRD